MERISMNGKRCRRSLLMVVLSLAMVHILVFSFAGEAEAKESDVRTEEAVFLGVNNYDGQGTDKDHRDYFTYRFSVDGQECLYLFDRIVND